MPNDDIMTVKELANYLKSTEKTAYRFASEGKDPGFKVGNVWRFRKSEIDAGSVSKNKKKVAMISCIKVQRMINTAYLTEVGKDSCNSNYVFTCKHITCTIDTIL